MSSVFRRAELRRCISFGKVGECNIRLRFNRTEFVTFLHQVGQEVEQHYGILSREFMLLADQVEVF